MKKRALPRRVWIVIDRDPMQYISEVYTRKREAFEQCERLNRMPKYDPTCVVVAFDRVRP